jgi:nucleoside-diphosphate kinase
MQGNLTFTIIKPCAIKSGYMGAILNDIQKAGFEISAMKFVQMTQTQAETFYSVHKGLPFYEKLIQFMISGPVVVAILKRENAVAEYRKLIGTTHPENAAEGTIRKKYAKNERENAVHGSDSDENAAIESNFFFSQCERF